MGKFDYDSRFPNIIADLEAQVNDLTRAAAKQIEARAKNRVPVNTGRLKNAIHTEQVEPGVQSVTAGDTDVFYGHLVEFGEASYPARPFLVPALEESRDEVVRDARTRLRDL